MSKHFLFLFDNFGDTTKSSRNSLLLQTPPARLDNVLPKKYHKEITYLPGIKVAYITPVPKPMANSLILTRKKDKQIPFRIYIISIDK